MPDDSPAMKPDRPSIKRFILTVLAVGILSLQVVLLRQTYLYTNDFLPPFGTSGDAWYDNTFRNDTWKQYCHDVLNLHQDGQLKVLSAAVCEKELMVLVDKEIVTEPEFYHGTTSQREILRIDLQSGRITTRRAAPSLPYIVSDGSQIWWLGDPSEWYGAKSKWKNPSESAEHEIPFAYKGRPLVLTNHRETDTFQLHEWRNSSWYRLGHEIVLPSRTRLARFEIEPDGSTSYAVVSTSDIRNHHFDFVVYMHPGVPIGQRPNISKFQQGQNGPSDDQFLELGWVATRFGTGVPSVVNPFGIWLRNAQVELIEYDFESDRNLLLPSTQQKTFRWKRFVDGALNETKEAPSPILWPAEEGPRMWSGRNLETENSLFTITSAAGEQYVIWATMDHRFNVMKWEQGRLSLIAQQGSRWNFFSALLLASDFAIVVIGPMLLLMLFAGLIDRGWPRPTIASGTELFEAATCVRRSIARFLDLLIPLTLLTLAIVMHPDSIAWVVHLNQVMTYSVQQFKQSFGVTTVGQQFEFLRAFASELLTILTFTPFVRLLLISAVVFSIGQIIWQGTTGWTAGKWLMSIKVIQRGSRQCGVARSLLREVLLVVDSLILLSWIPGVISILSSKQSQRFGDYWSDTAVVRVKPTSIASRDPTSLVLPRSEIDHVASK